MTLLEKKLCSGCGSCMLSCPKGAISMKADENGFLYPEINAQCIDCGLCQKACPVLTPKPQKIKAAYAAMAQDDLRMESSSGGVFTLLAEAILSQGGGVFGAAMDENLQLSHILVEQPQQLYRLRGSKYVQSQIGDSYKNAKALLTQGRPVLFTGTPCQINGLRSYLGKNYPNLYCQDIICHGAPAPGVWRRYVAYREEKAGSKAISVNFRWKESGWKSYRLKMEFENGQSYVCPFTQDPYMQAFLADLCLRPSCHSCTAKGENHQADLTLGDFWGIEQLHPELFDDKGTSLVLVHTEKGQTLLDSIRQHLKLHPTDAAQALKFNPAMNRPAPQHKNRESFLKAIQAGDFQKITNKHRPKHPIRKLKAAVKKLLKTIFSCC